MITTPTNKSNWIGKLKEHIRNKRVSGPVQRVDPMMVNIRRELRREQDRKIRENGGIIR